jgi:hypothetical protein
VEQGAAVDKRNLRTTIADRVLWHYTPVSQALVPIRKILQQPQGATPDITPSTTSANSPATPLSLTMQTEQSPNE